MQTYLPIYVSLTSICQNQDILVKTLESIENQTLLPNKCYIYLSEEPYLLDAGFMNKNLSPELDGIIKSNNLFELVWTPNIGPYRKLLPLLKEKINEDCIIITIDDDTVYDIDLIKNYYNDYIANKCCISYRAFTLNMKHGIHNCDYKDRLPEIGTSKLWNFHTGKGGVVYHPTFFKNTENIFFDNNIYHNLCEVGDDVWFNLCRIINKIPCLSLKKNYMTVDNTQKHSLYYTFNFGDNNTIMIRRTIKKLLKLGFQIPDNSYQIDNCNKQTYYKLSRLSLSSLDSVSEVLSNPESPDSEYSESVSPHFA